MAQVYRVVSASAFALAGVSGLLAVFLWFKLGIWKLIGDLSGRNARRSIEQMREQREKTKRFQYCPDEAERPGQKTVEWKQEDGIVI